MPVKYYRVLEPKCKASLFIKKNTNKSKNHLSIYCFSWSPGKSCWSVTNLIVDEGKCLITQGFPIINATAVTKFKYHLFAVLTKLMDPGIKYQWLLTSQKRRKIDITYPWQNNMKTPYEEVLWKTSNLTSISLWNQLPIYKKYRRQRNLLRVYHRDAVSKIHTEK